MAQIVPVGMNIDGSGGLYGGLNSATAEERALASNGCATRITAIRKYRNWFTQPFTGGADEVTFFNSGHLLLLSVSNLTKSPGPSDFTHKKLAAGNYDTDIDTMWDRIAGLSFDSNVTSQSRSITTTNASATVTGTFTDADKGATISGTNIQAATTILSQTGTAAVMSKTATGSGAVTATIVQGLTWPYIEFIYEHEVDAKGVDGKPGNLYYSNGGTSGTKDTTTDFKNAWIHLRSRWLARAAVAGVPTSRVKFNLCFTSFGFSPDRVTQYYPGDAYVDIIGVDPYPAVTSTGYVSAMSAVRPWVIARNKPMSIPEYNFISTNDSARPAAFNGMTTAIANETQITYDSLCLFLYPDSTPGYAINKVAGDSASGKAYPLTHAAYLSQITTLGGNPIRTVVVQGDPSAPVILNCTSNAAGTQITLTWDNPPAGDNVTGFDVYIAQGASSSPSKVNASPLAAATRSYVFTKLADGTLIQPRTTYTTAAVAINNGTPRGRSGYSDLSTSGGQITTQQPGGNPNAPTISAQSAVNDPANSSQIDFTITAASPLSRPLTITHNVTGPAGFSETFISASTNRTYATPGPYTDNVLVADNATPPNTTPTTLTFTIPSGGPITPNLGLYRPVSGTRVSDPAYGPGMLGNFDLLDTVVYGNIIAKSPHNLIHGLVGSTYDPVHIGGTNVYTSASGNLIWAAIVLQDQQISGLTLVTGTAQGGTGTQLGIHDSNGAILTDSVGNTCSYGVGAVQTSVNVDGWLQTAFTPPTPPPILTLPAPINGVVGQAGIGPKSIIYVSLFFPAGLSPYPTLRTTSTGGVEAVINLATQPRYGLVTGQTGLVDPLPFASWSTSSVPVWIGLF